MTRMTRMTLKTALLIGLAHGLMACEMPPPEPGLVLPERMSWETDPVIKAVGLVPDANYTFILERPSLWGGTATETSTLIYTANDRGEIDTSRQPANGAEDGSVFYPFRAMTYKREPADGLSPGELRIRLSGPDNDLIDEAIILAGADRNELVEMDFSADFPGAFILKKKSASSPQPAIVLLGGSEGGDGAARMAAPDLADAGFTVLGLPYYSPAWGNSEQQFPGLNRSFAALPIDYLEDAVRVLRARDDVRAGHVMLKGVSKGAEYVLLAGALIPDDSPGGGFCAIVADVPTDVVWEGWGAAPEGHPEGQSFSSFSYRGEALDFVPYANISRGIDRSDPYTLAQSHADGRKAHPDRVAPARIPVEQIDEPVLIIGGDKDSVWPSGPMARAIKATRDEAGLTTTAFIYEEGGHGVGGTPFRRGNTADGEARAENYPATLRFLLDAAKRKDCRG